MARPYILRNIGGMMKQTLSIGTLAITLALGLSTTSPAQSLVTEDDSDAYPIIRMGEDIATLWCDACHIIGKGDDDEGFDGAPPFPSIAHLVRANPDYYIAFLTSPHAKPMEAITISRDGITAVLSYIASLNEEE
jgi:mono/diheme cytochrome c family protein